MVKLTLKGQCSMAKKVISQSGALGKKIPYPGDPKAPIVLQITVTSSQGTTTFPYVINTQNEEQPQKSK